MNLITLDELHITTPAITAASALININNRIFTVCDDQYGLYELQNDLWIYHQDPNAPQLPKVKKELKVLKLDYEALLASIDEDSILLIPSGSKANRTHVLSFNLLTNKFTPLNFGLMYKNLWNKIPLINIEGAVLYKGNYLFLNRGIMSSKSSIISVRSKTLDIEQIVEIDLGIIGDVFLHGSELCIHENFLYLLGVAEDADNSYDDGPIIGSSLFKFSLADFKVLDRWKLNLPIKAEGLCRWKDRWIICTDPDGAVPSKFYSFST